MLNIIKSHLIRTHCNQILFRETPSTIKCSGRFNKSAPAGIVIQSRFVVSESAGYAGDGKTTVRVLNNEETSLNLVNTYSSTGFRLSNNLFVRGSILLFPTNVFSWNVKRGKDITPESLLIFDLIVPKVKVVIIGYGQYHEEYDSSIPLKLKKKGISCEMLATPNAVTTYNYLANDSVLVVGAFVPVRDEVRSEKKDHFAIRGYDSIFEEKEHFINVPKIRSFEEEKDIALKTVYREKPKKKFDE